MSYNYSLENIKEMKNLLEQYHATTDLTAYEFMRSYIEKCPENTKDFKIAWVAETLLGIDKHYKFLQSISNHLSEQLSHDDQLYFTIIFQAIIFQIGPKFTKQLYKCLFQLSKPLLDTFSDFLSNNEVLPFITEVAHALYDTKYVEVQIVEPIFHWQPYISEMAHNYAEYLEKVRRRNAKQPTVPVQPNFTQARSKRIVTATVSSPSEQQIENARPSKKMLTKSAIDKKLMKSHEKNKIKALKLLQEAQHIPNYEKSEKYYERIAILQNEMDKQFKPLKRDISKAPKVLTPIPARDTASTLRRMNKRIEEEEQEELKWLEDVLKNCASCTKYEDALERCQQQIEMERLLKLEKNRLMVQLSYEEAILAKKKLLEDNKKRYEEVENEKKKWREEVIKWKKAEMEKLQNHMENLSMTELKIMEAKENILLQKREIVENLKNESERIRESIFKARQEELEKRINVIKQIKVLALLARKARVARVIDLTESSGLGLFGEMSIAELQERLASMKFELQEQLATKKQKIKEVKDAAKQELETVKKKVECYKMEKAINKPRKKSCQYLANSGISLRDAVSSSKEITELQKKLEEKRKERLEKS